MHRLTLVLSSLVLCVVTGMAFAQAETPVATLNTTQSLTGTVVTSDASTLLVRAADGSEVSLQIAPGAHLPARLTAGQQITVQYTTDAQGVRRATYASIVAPAMTPSSTAEESTPPSEPAAPVSARTPELPATASPLWWAAVIGCAAVGASLTLRRLRC